MESPFRSEEAAFRFLLITIGAFALIVLASWISTALGFLTFLGLSAAAVAVYLRQRGPAPERTHVAPLETEGGRRVLVVANETVAGEELLSTISTLALSQQTHFRVVCPALNSRLRTFTSDEDPAREAAQQRLDDTLARLASVGIDAHGEVGDGDPLVAVDDAVRTFDPNEIVISTHPLGKSNWLERGVVESIRARYDVPVTHVVVDLGRGDSAASLLAGDGRDVVRDRLDLLIVELALERRHRAAAVRHLCDHLVFASASPASRFGPTLPDVPASASVWHEPQFVVKIVLPSVGFSAVTPVPATAPTYFAMSWTA